MKTSNFKPNDEKNLFKGIVAGAIGGLVASFVMTQYQNATAKFAETESDKKSNQKESEPATVRAAEAVSEKLFDHQLEKSEKEPAGEAMHYLMGGISGAIYGATAELTGAASFAEGLPFGSAVWAIADDVVVPALGLSKPATQYSLATHAYALSSHWVYGLVTEIVRKQIRKAL